jgi:uncharacterized protein
MKAVILDSGPLVAWYCRKDQHHAWARRVFRDLAPGSLVCESVLTEVCHLVAMQGVSRSEVIKSLLHGRIEAVSLTNELTSIVRLLERYADAPMDFADAFVVRLAELNPLLPVCTVDGQFSFFRKNENEPISLIAPFTMPT